MVVPIRRKGGWVSQDKANSFLFEGAVNSYCALVGKGGHIMSPLNAEETEFFEEYYGRSLNPRLKSYDDNFWMSASVDLKNEVLTLDLSNADDYINYKILLKNTNAIAPDGESKLKKGTYKYALQEVEFEERKASEKAKMKRKANVIAEELDTKGKSAMIDFLNVIFLKKGVQKIVNGNTSYEALNAELDKLVMTDPQEMISVYGDKYYSDRVLLNKAIRSKAVIKKGSSFVTKDGTLMGSNIEKALLWLQDAENSEERLLIEAIIEEAKGL